MSDYTLTVVQAGSSTAGGDWTDYTGTNIAFASISTPIGITYDVQGTLPFNDSSGLALDPPLWVGGGSITITPSLFGGNFSLYLRTDPAAELFSDTNPPLLTIGTNTLLTTGTLILDPVVVTFDTEMDTTIRATQTSRTLWNGRVQFILTVDTGFSSTLTVGSFVDVEMTPFFSGLAGGPYLGKVRAVRDGRYAMGVFSPEVIRDGDQPSLWVRTFDWDPEDEDATYRPRPGEGTVDDDIGSV